MTKLDLFMLRVNLFEVSQTYGLCSSVLTNSFSNDLRLLSAKRILVSSAKR